MPPPRNLATALRAPRYLISVWPWRALAYVATTAPNSGVLACGLLVVGAPVYAVVRNLAEGGALVPRWTVPVALPLVIDVADRSLRWLDVARGVTGTDHAVHRHLDPLALLGWALCGYFASPARVRLGEVARWHAAARASPV